MQRTIVRVMTRLMISSIYECAGRRLLGCFVIELPGVFGNPPVPTLELHGIGADDAADGSSAEQAIKNIESDVPPGSAPRDVSAVDRVPQRQARPASKGFEFPALITVLKNFWSLGSRHFYFDRRRRSHPGEIHRPNRTQARIGDKGRPLAQLRLVG